MKYKYLEKDDILQPGDEYSFNGYLHPVKALYGVSVAYVRTMLAQNVAFRRLSAEPDGYELLGPDALLRPTDECARLTWDSAQFNIVEVRFPDRPDGATPRILNSRLPEGTDYVFRRAVETVEPRPAVPVELRELMTLIDRALDGPEHGVMTAEGHRNVLRFLVRWAKTRGYEFHGQWIGRAKS